MSRTVTYSVPSMFPADIMFAAVAGQFVRAAWLRGGSRFWLCGEVPRTGQPVHQRGFDPVVRCSFSEGGTLVPYGLGLNTQSFVCVCGQKSMKSPILSGRCGVDIAGGRCLLSAPLQPRRRI
ncbi:hypothetical protein ILYODFUR_016475 [Ilyodon furcidens]|uniref:Uncharacterized protein n=1 Tax=Ilyodon furcidens TaxID=33524 RepID=A0ABV0U7R3_9TELE